MFSETSDLMPGVVLKTLGKHSDTRGWLAELYREDELPEGFTPAMGYMSVTKAGVARGPHEHANQTDGFVFMSGQFRLYLWENRTANGDAKIVLEVGEANPVFVTVPPGVVHAYKNVGGEEAFVLNFPDRLYAGWAKKDEVDEYRHEDDPNTRFMLE